MDGSEQIPSDDIKFTIIAINNLFKTNPKLAIEEIGLSKISIGTSPFSEQSIFIFKAEDGSIYACELEECKKLEKNTNVIINSTLGQKLKIQLQEDGKIKCGYLDSDEWLDPNTEYTVSSELERETNTLERLQSQYNSLPENSEDFMIQVKRNWIYRQIQEARKKLETIKSIIKSKKEEKKHDISEIVDVVENVTLEEYQEATTEVISNQSLGIEHRQPVAEESKSRLEVDEIDNR